MSAPAAVVVGDGTTAASRAGARWRRVRWPLVVVLVVLVAGVLASLLQPRTSEVPLAPDNPEPGGARALAEILRDRGVRVDHVTSTGEALRLAGAGSTLLVTGTWLLDDSQVEQLTSTDADLVVVEPEAWHIAMLTDGAVDAGWDEGGAGPRPASCADPDAQAAGEVVSDGVGLVARSPDAVVCFPDPAAPEAGGAYASVDDGRVVLVDDSRLMTNEALGEAGHAALMLRALGRHEHLVWYVPSFDDVGGGDGPDVSQFVPAWAWPLVGQLLVVLLVVVLWRARALGPVVTEPLPVTVRAAETTLGRGRLYRRSRSRGHAAAALRAGVARRTAARLGLPRSAGAPAVIDALARATGRSTEQVAGLLYGPPPTDDAGLLRLAQQLDQLESEVHRT